ncbi:ABC transporter ATP-binding protein [Candidatus Contubernalis alkaliaceticus]|uniref:ABC transporter ATP-binding protein n=1 Tax=Candidatus Contubernalis alkaliaceticus TaxID=338645 RepID=UPI001F4C1EEA|nr:ATP-binding cassette domain-containing protein [Candidatus Contubernalis alkalaceticus]UNC92263.1 ATP-binding cassette domain-containing protein [Candidatus Contubernalis alkalaceticus]
MFVLKNVSFKHILKIEQLRIPQRKITCIVGESGSGKTTLLKLLNHMISSDNGDIFYQGKNLQNYDPIQLRREVVMLSQVPLIFPGTILDNLIIGLEFSEKPPVTEGELRQLLKSVKLGKDLSDNALELSGGEKQRLALCRILLMEPEVFLLDEPSSALDDETEEMIIEQMVSFTKKKKKTLVMVTHSKRIARSYGEFIVTMDRGKITQVEGG